MHIVPYRRVGSTREYFRHRTISEILLLCAEKMCTRWHCSFKPIFMHLSSAFPWDTHGNAGAFVDYWHFVFLALFNLVNRNFTPGFLTPGICQFCLMAKFTLSFILYEVPVYTTTLISFLWLYISLSQTPLKKHHFGESQNSFRHLM
jgi:hypothetical protein